MGRVINVSNPTKIRNYNRRTVAELLRRLLQKREVDDESKDMAATIVYALREIDASVETTVEAWEKRDYWMKAERFQRQWTWVKESAANLEDVLRHEAWDLLPELLAELLPRFDDIKVKTMTRKPEVWRNAYQRLVAEPASELPW